MTTAFNADFDGDQIRAVHVPLSDKAVEEARRLMLSTANLLKPADGESVVGPSKDMVLGVYYLTTLDPSRPHRGDGRIFANMDEVELAYSLEQVEVHTRIKMLGRTWYDEYNSRLPEAEERLIDTTVGRVIFNRILPPEIQFVNIQLDKGGLKDLISEMYAVGGEDQTPDVADRIKDIGFTFATSVPRTSLGA